MYMPAWTRQYFPPHVFSYVVITLRTVKPTEVEYGGQCIGPQTLEIEPLPHIGRVTSSQSLSSHYQKFPTHWRGRGGRRVDEPTETRGHVIVIDNYVVLNLPWHIKL